MNAKYGGEKISCTQLDSVEAVLKTADIVSLHTVLDETTKGMIDKAALEMMKPDAVLVNSSRGPIINETDLVAHLQANPDFRCGALRIAVHPSGSHTVVLLCTVAHYRIYPWHDWTFRPDSSWARSNSQVWTCSKTSH